MPAPFHPDVKRLCVLFCKWLPLEIVASEAGMSARTLHRALQEWSETGDAIPAPSGLQRGRKPILDEEELQYIANLVFAKNTRYLDEIQDLLSQNISKEPSLSTLCRAMASMKITHKQITRAASERNSEQRTEYTRAIAQFAPDQLVFLDECYVDKRNTIRRRGYNTVGHRAREPAPFRRGRRYTVLPAICLDGALDITVLEGACNGATFSVFIQNLLMEMNPYPAKNSVLVMDNVQFHKDDELIELIEQRGMKLVYLPPYSPDYNPIEESFSAVKAWIKRHNIDVREAMDDEDHTIGIAMVTHAYLTCVTPEKCRGWFKDCGYF